MHSLCPQTRAMRFPFCTFIIPHLDCFVKGYFEFFLRYCIAHNPLLLQPLGHWFTFIFRKYEHLAVGSLGQGLTRSRGHPPFRGRLALAFCTLIVSQLGRFVKGFFTFFFEPAGLVIDPLPQVLSWEGLYSLSP